MEVNLGPASVVGEKGLKSQPGGGGNSAGEVPSFMSAFFGGRDMSNWRTQRSVPIQPNIQNSKEGLNKLGRQKKHQL